MIARERSPASRSMRPWPISPLAPVSRTTGLRTRTSCSYAEREHTARGAPTVLVLAFAVFGATEGGNARRRRDGRRKPGRRSTIGAAGLSGLLALAAASTGAAADLTPARQLGRDLLRELVETDTTHEHGSTTKAAEALARRLVAAGYAPADVQVVGPAGSPNANLVARLRGKGTARPILLLAHLDVMEAKK